VASVSKVPPHKLKTKYLHFPVPVNALRFNSSVGTMNMMNSSGDGCKMHRRGIHIGYWWESQKERDN
jgi:hypothetical protein